MTHLLDADNPAVLLFNARGDYVLSLPTIRALSCLYEGRLTIVCWPGARDNFFPEVTAKRVIEPAVRFSGGRFVFDPVLLASELEPVDVFFSLNPWHDELMEHLVACLHCVASVGHHPGYSVEKPVDHRKHNIDQIFDIARAVDDQLRADAFSDPPALTLETRNAVTRIMAEIPSQLRVLAVHAETKGYKQWLPNRFAAVLQAQLRNHDDLIVFEFATSGIGMDYGRFADRVVKLKALPLPVAMGLVGAADRFIGIDSCLLHVADLYRVPSVGLFGPSPSREFGFRFAPSQVVDARGPMENIDVDSVLAACDALERQLADRDDVPALRRR